MNEIPTNNPAFFPNGIDNAETRTTTNDSQGLDEAQKRKLRKVSNLREDLKADKPLEERLEELRQIRAEKDRLDEAAEEYAINEAVGEDDNKDKELLKSFPQYDEKNPSSLEGSRDYWESVFEHETNRDTELHKAFGELHIKIVNEVIQFCKEHNLDVDEFCVSADGLLGSREFGEWCPCTDSSMSMHIAVKDKNGYWRIDREKPFLYEI